MFKKQFMLAVAVALAVGAYAQAAPINLIEVANYQRNTLVGGSGSPQSVDYTGSGGVTYNNVYDASGLVAGAHFISLEAVPITQLITNGAGNQTPTGTANLVEIAALQGVVTSASGSTVTVQFTSGVARLYQSNTTFVANNLATWGFTGTASAVGTGAVDDKLLKPQEALLVGNPNAYNSTGATGNPASVNVLSATVIPGNSVNGTAITQNGTGPDIWANRTQNGIPGNQIFGLNGAVFDFTDVFQLSSNTNFAFDQGTPGNAVNLPIANAIIAALGTESPGLLLNGGLFASGVDNGLNSGYNANLTSTGTTTGDFSSQTSNNVAPTIETQDVFVPEPASMAAWGLVMAGVGAYRVIRRRKQKAA